MKQEKIKEKPAGQRKTTRGKVDRLDRVEWFYLKKELDIQEIQLSQWNRATCPARVDDSVATLVRIFDPDTAKEQGLTIEDYESLNEHPALILYEGYYIRGRGGETIIVKREGTGPSFLDKKIADGAITEIGMIPEKTTTQKWLGGFGRFLMMGGFLVVLVVGVAIVIAISLLSNGC